MWKRVLWSVGIIIVLVIGIEIFNNYKSKTDKNEYQDNLIRNETEIGEKYVTDDCINEWSDYAETREEEIQETTEMLNDENRHYILKEKDGVISVYYINDKNEEILYKVTDIAVEYLPEEDLKNLEQGIDVYGIQNLNLLLEDFE